MEDAHSQAWLFQRANRIKHELYPLRLTKRQRAYLRAVLERYRRRLSGITVLILAATLCEIAIPLVTHVFLKRYSLQLEWGRLSWAFAGLVALAVVYLGIAYQRIKHEKTAIVLLLNELRHEWVAFFLRKSPLSLRHHDKGVLLTRISYHLSLLQMGLGNAFFVGLQSVLLVVGLVAVTFFIDTRLLILVLATLPFCAILFAAGYVVSRFYLSQDQTLYSKILQYVSDVFNELPAIHFANKRPAVLDHLDQMVSIDSYFRVRRELWLKFGNVILFVLLALLTGAFYLVETMVPFFELDGRVQLPVYIIVSGILIKLLYQSLRVGLFAFPVTLGLVLCIGEGFPLGKRRKQQPIREFSEISFSAKKVRLFPDGPMVRDKEFRFRPGDRVLITGREGSGKSTLGQLFSGLAPLGFTKPWRIRVQGERLSYQHWRDRAHGLTTISPFFQSQGTVFEFFSQQHSYDSPPTDIRVFLERLAPYPELKGLLSHVRVLGKRITPQNTSFAELGILQMAACLLHAPRVLVVDNTWLDLRHEGVDRVLQLLDRELTSTVLICFARNRNDLLDYDQYLTI